MKIKTIKNRLDNAVSFDKELNQALAEGYQLVRRDIVPGFRLDCGNYLHNMLYAELVLPDPAAEPETVDPVNLLRQVQEFCLSVPPSECNADRCPLAPYCQAIQEGQTPDEWVFPEEADA